MQQVVGESSIQIPNKSMFKLNEVCGLVGVKPYVLRYWESEFEEVSPITSSSGQKLYEHQDIEAISIIKKLLFTDKLSIEQAKEKLEFIHKEPISIDQEESEELTSHSGSQVIRSLSDSDIQKLVMSKAKLNSLLMLVDEVKQTHNWS